MLLQFIAATKALYLRCSYCSVTIINLAVRPGICILRPEAGKVPCDRRSQNSMSHRVPIFVAGGRHSCLWAEPTRVVDSHFPPKTGRMITSHKIIQITFLPHDEEMVTLTIRDNQHVSW